MKLLYQRPKTTVALLTIASAISTIAYSNADKSQNDCNSLGSNSTLAAMRSELGIFHTEFEIYKTDGDLKSLRESANREASIKSVPGVTTLGKLADSQGYDPSASLEKQRNDLQDLLMDQNKTQVQLVLPANIESARCGLETDYSGIFLVFQVLLTALAAFFGFAAGVKSEDARLSPRPSDLSTEPPAA